MAKTNLPPRKDVLDPDAKRPPVTITLHRGEAYTGYVTAWPSHPMGTVRMDLVGGGHLAIARSFIASVTRTEA